MNFFNLFFIYFYSIDRYSFMIEIKSQGKNLSNKIRITI